MEVWRGTVLQDTFRKMYALSSYVEALTPMPEDDGHSIKGLFGLTYLGDMRAEIRVLGYGSGDGVVVSIGHGAHISWVVASQLSLLRL
ncbi:hypothetical protein Tco_1241170 [Tanacetum coccineum]